jgi:hypothetical protein
LSLGIYLMAKGFKPSPITAGLESPAMAVDRALRLPGSSTRRTSTERSRRLSGLGGLVRRGEHPDGQPFAFVTDPDGYVIEL